MPERATVSSRSEKSAEAVVVGGKVESRPAGEGPNERECSRPCRCGEHCIRCLRKQGGPGCRRNDIPYVLELLVYPFLGSANHTADYVESPGELPALMIESVREFAKPEYAVDLLKLESPLAANDLPARDGSAAAKAAQKEFAAIGAICSEQDIPWVLFSGGAAHDKFERVLEYAYAAGAGGFLAGRTIWLNAVRTHFPDLAAVSAVLNKESVAILNSLSKLTKERANSWEPRFPKFDHVRHEGDFARAY